MIDFSEQVVIVTGAGRGLGRLFALDFARRGARVVVNDLGGSMSGSGADKSVADVVVEEIARAGGLAVSSHDSVASPEGADAIVSAALKHFGRLDAVVSNAGIFTTVAFEELSVEHWKQMTAVHLDGGFFLSQRAYRVMIEQGYGRFVFMSSSAGVFGQPHEAHYAAAKSGLVGLSNVIAIEGAPYGVLSNCVLPFGFSRMAAETVGGQGTDHPFLKAIDPELVVPIVTYLASRACEVTHQNYSACAGRYARVFSGLGAGWTADSTRKPSAEDIAESFDKISKVEPFLIPESIFDEIGDVCQQLKIDLE